MHICPAQPWRICASVVTRTLRACFGDFALGGEILRIWSVAVALSAVMLRCEQALTVAPPPLGFEIFLPWLHLAPTVACRPTLTKSQSSMWEPALPSSGFFLQ